MQTAIVSRSVGSPVFFGLMLVFLLILSPTTTCAGCNPFELSPCLPAVTSNARPSFFCCSRLKKQRSCLCGYTRNPSLSHRFTPTVAKKISHFCKLPVVKC
ncbi:putative non-specific lipid-transfer protein AKCS9 [Zostera marina]|uniref:Putative non-specific lipid-transfer protein AKCS9 n=1 Tax=Zostera marina TaxID=29655 RepID=A0A0K9Q307_ZOSMR|nr:putative non-specific lipid-transfer protein AKCS9 [Zostera marina]